MSFPHAVVHSEVDLTDCTAPQVPLEILYEAIDFSRKIDAPGAYGICASVDEETARPVGCRSLERVDGKSDVCLNCGSSTFRCANQTVPRHALVIAEVVGLHVDYSLLTPETVRTVRTGATLGETHAPAAYPRLTVVEAARGA